MTRLEWLDAVGRANAAQEPARYRVFAPTVQRVAPRLALTARTAASMGLLLRGQFPTAQEFADALGQHLPGAVAKRVMRDGPIDPPPPAAPPVAPRPPDAVEADRRFWVRRIERLEAAPVGPETLADAQGLWRSLSRPGAAERPGLLDRLWSVVADLERRLDRVGETAALPPLDVRGPVVPVPVFAKARPRRPVAAVPPNLLDLMWERAAAAGGLHARMRADLIAARRAREEKGIEE